MPVASKGELLVRIVATTVAAADWRVRAFIIPPGLRTIARLALGFAGPRARILGTQLSGEVIAIGANVKRFRIGDSVIAFTGAAMRCHAEYRVLPENAAVIIKPECLSYPEAAALSFGGTTALYYLRDKGQIQRGHRVLVIGASGAVGTAAVQLAKHFGAEVTAVCRGATHGLVRSLGASHVIDSATGPGLVGATRYDLIFNTVESITWAQARPFLSPSGKFLMVSATLVEMLRGLSTGGRALSGMVPERRDDLEFLAGLADTGAFRPVIDRTYPFAEIVRAHHHAETGHKSGNVVVQL